jgi:hypothetical protein
MIRLVRYRKGMLWIRIQSDLNFFLPVGSGSDLSPFREENLNNFCKILFNMVQFDVDYINIS